MIVAIIVAAGLLTYARLPDRYRALLQTQFLSSREQRLIHFFGECEPGGYGYLKRVLAVYSRLEPNSRKRPVIRYRDYNRRSEYLFEPTRFEGDPSVLVGVGLTESDMEEREMRSALPAPDGTWRFPVESNFDLLTRIEVEFERRTANDLRLRLYRSERDETPIWTSTETVVDVARPSMTEGARLQFVARPPLSQFRFGLVIPFVVRIDGGAAIRRVTAYGIVVSMQGYRVVHRRGTCFTAVQQTKYDLWARSIRELERSDD